MLIKIFQTKPIKKILITTIIFSLITTGLTRCLKLDKVMIQELLDEINRKIVKNKELNQNIINNPELIKRRVERTVDSAIREYERFEREHYVPRMKNEQILNEAKKYDYNQRSLIEGAIYYELPQDNSEAQKLLGRPMGIRAPWTEPHPNEISQ